MVKRIVILVTGAALLLTGCGTAAGTETTDSGEAAVVEYRIDWETEERKVPDFPENAAYLGCTENGYFYCVQSGETEADASQQFYFCPWDGEAVPLLESSAQTYSAFMHGDWLILYLADAMTSKVVGIAQDGTQWEILADAGSVVPSFYGYQEYLLILTSETVPGTDDTRDRITRANAGTLESEILYQTEDRIVCMSESEAGCLIVEGDYEGSQTMRLYDASCQNKLREIMLETPVIFAAENDGSYYLSERGDLGENLGAICQWSEDTLETVGWLPFVAEDNIIWDALKTENAWVLNAQNTGYMIDADGRLWVLDFEADEEAGKLRHMGEDGFSGIVERSDGDYWIGYYCE